MGVCQARATDTCGEEISYRRRSVTRSPRVLPDFVDLAKGRLLLAGRQLHAVEASPQQWTIDDRFPGVFW